MSAPAQPRFTTVPIFRIFDEGKARDFYLGFLGMSVDWEHRFEPGTPIYMQVGRDELKLHLSEHHGDCCPGSTVYVETQELEALHKEITAKGYKYNRPGLDDAPWGGKIMEVIDPFGNRIRFCGP